MGRTKHDIGPGGGGEVLNPCSEHELGVEGKTPTALPPPSPTLPDLTQYQVCRITEFAFMCEQLKLPQESILQAATRLLITAAVAETDFQRDAACLLGISSRMLNHHLSKYRMRRCDRKRRAKRN